MKHPPLRPVTWSPPRPPGWGRLPAGAPDLPLRRIEVPGAGPEDVVLDTDGNIVTGLADGRVLRIAPDGARYEVLADTGGRPLGVERLPDGAFLLCDAYRGLLRLERDGRITTLATEGGGLTFGFCNNAAVASDGTIYFTDSSQRFQLEHWMADLLEHSGTGRLLRRDPDGGIEVLRAGLHFPNGVALASDESYLVYAETGTYALTRLWLAGPKAGESEPLVASLPGFPDNLSTGDDGLIWVALASPRNPMLDAVSPLPGVLRKASWALPYRLQPTPARATWVVAIDADGRVVHDVHDHGRTYHMVTGVREHAGTLYLGSLVERAIAVLAVPESTSA